jgi:hypothetical protein
MGEKMESATALIVRTQEKNFIFRLPNAVANWASAAKEHFTIALRQAGFTNSPDVFIITYTKYSNKFSFWLISV